MPNPKEPDLRIGFTGKETLSCRVVILIHLIRTRFDIDSNEFALVFRLDVRADITVVDFLPASSEFLFAVLRLYRWHCFPPDWVDLSLLLCSSCNMGFGIVAVLEHRHNRTQLLNCSFQLGNGITGQFFRFGQFVSIVKRFILEPFEAVDLEVSFSNFANMKTTPAIFW
jgi:hypothetical protein